MNVTGQTDLVSAKYVLDAMDSKNITAAFQATGTQSLEELANKIQGIPTQRSSIAAMAITGEKDLDSALGKLQTFAGTKNANLILKQSGFENMTQLINQLNGVPDQKTAKLTAQALGLSDIKLVDDTINAILNNNGKSASVSVSADTTDAENKINSLGGAGVAVNLDASASIQNIKNELQNSIDLALSSSKGSGYLEEIKGFVESIKDLVQKIEPKLPVAALA